MSRSPLVARRLTPLEAMDLWTRSDEASAFTRPDYLDRLVDEVEWWGVDRSGEVLAAWPLVRASIGHEIGPPPFCYYVGPMFDRQLWEGESYHRQWSTYTDVFAALVSEVVSNHRRFRFSMPPGLTDLRVLEWWNFDHQPVNGFYFRPRYTARIDLSQFKSDAEMRKSLSANRRREIDRWAASPPEVVEDVTEEFLMNLHAQVLTRGTAAIPPSRIVALRRMIALVKSGAGIAVGFRPEGQKNAVAGTILIDGPTESNAVFYAADSAWRSTGLTAWAVWHGMRRARNLGKRWFDFNGANSPARADDKHRYNGRADLYFDCGFS